jgi:rare lipoprotein A (peptidoglycan hydrolase)
LLTFVNDQRLSTQLPVVSICHLAMDDKWRTCSVKRCNQRWSGRSRAAAVAAALAALGLMAEMSAVEAKVLGGTHCYFGICHRIKTLAETAKLVGIKTTVKASYYDDCKVDRFNPCTLTSSGEVFKPHRPDNAASPIYPDGTKLLVWNPKTKAGAIVRVNSAGPYHSNRTLDVSRATAEKLGFKKSGVASLHVQVISAPTPQEAKYKKHRTYPAVAGPIGTFSSFEMAAADVARSDQSYAISVAAASAAAAKIVAAGTAKVANARAVKAAGHNATIAAIASISGTPSLATAMSASAILMNSVPHSLLPLGALGETKIAARNPSKAQVADRDRKVTRLAAPKT